VSDGLPPRGQASASSWLGGWLHLEVLDAAAKGDTPVCCLESNPGRLPRMKSEKYLFRVKYKYSLIVIILQYVRHARQVGIRFDFSPFGSLRQGNVM
jgi:hypothetical protein